MKRGAVIGIVGVVAVAATAVGIWWFLSRPPSAEAAANDYLRALEAGDYAVIETMSASPLDDTVAAAFAGAESHIADVRIVQLEAGADGQATVLAEALLGGERRDLAFALRSRDGRWLLTPQSLATVRVDTTFGGAPGGGDSAWIGEALVPTGTDVALLPAAYVVEAAPRGILSGSSTVAVSGEGDAETVTIDTALTPEATAIAQEQLDAYLDACAAPATDVPDHCGLRVPWAADLTSLSGIAFRIDERPVLELSADGSGFDATGGTIVATATGASRAGGTRSFTYRADDWAVRGTVAFVGDEMVLSVR
ncbi:UNVERIFIED_CONTAM: hypothetical protein OHV15_00375 [Microbacterium sp. SLM126]